MNCRNHPLSSSSFSSKNCSKTRSATVQVPLAAGRAPFGAAAQRDGRGVSEQLVSSDPSPPKHSTGHTINVRFGFCSSKQLFFRSLFGYLLIYIFRRAWEIPHSHIPSPAPLRRRNNSKTIFSWGDWSRTCFWSRQTASSDPPPASLKIANHHFQSCCPACSSSFRQEVSESSEVRGNPTRAEGKPHLGASTESDFYLFILCTRFMFHLSSPESRRYTHYWRKQFFQSLQSALSFLINW